MGVTENKTVDCWHSCLNGHEFEQIPGDSEGQGSLVCCSSCGFKVQDITVQLKNINQVNKEASEVCHTT